MEESKAKSKGAMLIEKEQFEISKEFEGARDLNLRPIAYTIFGMTVLFIIFISYLISQHK